MDYLKLAIAFIIVLIFSFSPIIFYYSSVDYVEATVTDKSIVVTGHKDATETIYLIFTDKEVFENDDLFLYGKFNSSDFYAKIIVDNKYKFKVYGWRIPFLSMYRNIAEFTLIK